MKLIKKKEIRNLSINGNKKLAINCILVNWLLLFFISIHFILFDCYFTTSLG